MKKQKIALNKLNLKKETIGSLDAGSRQHVLGGEFSLDICPAPTIQTLRIACNSLICITRNPQICGITRNKPQCIDGPVTTTVFPGPTIG